MRRGILLLLLPLALAPGAERPWDPPGPDGVRPGGTLTQSLQAPPIPGERSEGRHTARNYPDQPPTIPHGIRGYQQDKNFNQCLSCHSRSASATSGAPMVSITHFWTREGQPLAAVSPRRYFCLMCHVPQYPLEPVKRNTFLNIDQVLEKAIEQRGQERGN